MHDLDKITYFAQTDYRNKNVRFGIKAEDRTKHIYIIGKTGMGKSTLLENLAVQDIQNGEGLAFIDPHGNTADLLLDYVPKERVKDVLYLAPFDIDFPVSFNVMEDIGAEKRHLVVSGLMSTFKKIWVDAFSARMEHILGNTILALLEYPGATLMGINRMYSDKHYRNAVVSKVTDPAVRSFWLDEFAGYTDRFAAEATPAIQNKIGQFVSNPVIRNIVGQPKSSFDFREMMDNKKIIIINLSKGQVGESNANLLGSMITTKIYLAAMTRADVHGAKLKKLPNFYLYVDEFQSFANESFANILSEARKYKLNLTIAHQYMAQMSDEVRDAVIGNVGTMISFRVGAYDADLLEKEFTPQFTAEDMVSLGFAQIALKLMVDRVSSLPFSAKTLPPIAKPEVSYRDVVVAESRKQFAKPRAEVEDEIQAWHEKSYAKSRNEIKAEQEATSTKNKDKKSSPPASRQETGKFVAPKTVPTKSTKPPFTQTKTQPKVQTAYRQTPEQKKIIKSVNGENKPNIVNKPAHNTQTPQSVSRQDRETRLRKAISLNSLKVPVRGKPKSDTKSASMKNTADLKSALSEILKEVKKKEGKTELPKKTFKQTTNIKKENKSQEKPKKQKEVSEDVLKKVLDPKSKDKN